MVRIRALSVFLTVLALLSLPASANKSSVSIKAPASAKVGEEVKIQLNIFHRGNSSLHHTKKVVVLANQKEVARWEFSSSSRPESENFAREIKLKIEAETEIVAEASCNLHRSAGQVSVRIKVES